MNTYKRHRFPPDIISYSVWLYYRFNLSHRRDAGPFIEDLLAERGITVSREATVVNPERSLPTSCEVTVLLTGSRSLTRSTVRNNMKTIEQSNRMKQPG